MQSGWVLTTGGGDADGKAGSAGHERVPVRLGDGVSSIHRILAAYHLPFVAREPIQTGIVEGLRLPPQCMFWAYLLHCS
jgi:hypothetical protein